MAIRYTFKKISPFSIYGSWFIQNSNTAIFNSKANPGFLEKFNFITQEIEWIFEDGSIHFFDNKVWVKTRLNPTLKLISYSDASILLEIQLNTNQLCVGYENNDPIIRTQSQSGYVYQRYNSFGEVIWEGESELKIWQIPGAIWVHINDTTSKFEISDFYKFDLFRTQNEWHLNLIETFKNQISNGILTAESSFFRFYFQSNRLIDNQFLLDIGYQKDYYSAYYLSSIDNDTGKLQWFSEEEGVIGFKIYKEDIVLCRRGEIVIIDLKTGVTKKKGAIQLNGLDLEINECRHTVQNDLIYISFSNPTGIGWLGIVEMEQFNLIWHDVIDRPPNAYRFSLWAPIVIDQNIYLIDNDDRMHYWERVDLTSTL